MNLGFVIRALAGAALLWATQSVAAEQVDIAGGSFTLHATLYRPTGPGPFPAVVALHDCGGLSQRPNTLSQLYGSWAQHLVADGFAVLFPDSFGSPPRGPHRRAPPPPARG